MGMDLDRIPADDTPSTPAQAAADAAQRLQDQSQADRSSSSSRPVNTDKEINSIIGSVTIGESTAAGKAGQDIQRTMRDANVIRDFAEQLGNKLERRAPLSRTEQFFAGSLSNALHGHDVKSVMQVLGVLAENPKSAYGVLNNIRENLPKGVSANWEQGQTDSGEQFVRLRLTSGRTSVTIGSDGTMNASHTDKFGDVHNIDAGDALSRILPAFKKGEEINPNWKDGLKNLNNAEGSSPAPAEAADSASESAGEKPPAEEKEKKEENKEAGDAASTVEKMKAKLAEMAKAKAKLQALGAAVGGAAAAAAEAAIAGGQ